MCGRSFFDGRRGHVFFEVGVIEVSRDVVYGDAAFVVDAALHFGHRLLRLILRLVLNEQVTRIRADVLLIFFHEPVVHNGAKLREAFNQVFLVFVPLIFGQLAGHVCSHCVGDSEQGRGLAVSNLQSID